MHVGKSKSLLVRAAVVVAVVLAPLVVNPAPVLAAESCRTGRPHVGARQNRYNVVTRGIDLRRVHHFTFEVYAGSSYRVYRDPRQIIWRERVRSVSEVRAWVYFTARERGGAKLGCGWARR